MSGLSAREREVLTGIYVEELTNEQVAERLSISQGLVAQILTRATRRLLTEAVPTAAAGRQLERMIETMLPQEVPSPAEAWHAQQNAQARSELLAEFGALTAEEVAEQAGSTAANRSALASRWHSEGRIVGVPWQGRTLYPAFQFRDGRPDPTVRRAAALLRRRGLSGWALALWFVTPSGWLWDRRPVDLLAEDSERVLAAAGEALSLPA
ncbi:MAG: sigma factor-like helix-turn-helix DNA-binding protein [Solirubrobacteraceae bacterium]